MCPPASDVFEIAAVPDAGRGVIARCDIAAGTLVLESGPPAAHVVFQEYRKETCAYCFAWRLGRTLPVRDGDLGKYFCSAECQAEWKHEQGVIGIQAWSTVAAFTARNAKRRPSAQETPSGPKPSRVGIEAAWMAAAAQAQLVRQSRSAAAPLSKHERKRLQAIRQHVSRSVDADLLGYLLDAVLLAHRRPLPGRNQVQSLAMDETPYKTPRELEQHCQAFLQLMSILPESLLSHLSLELCLAVVQAGSHNAFGIRAGGEDGGEEYMGYGVYPSASYFNHACAPNILKRRTGRSWGFHAARDIRAGEECCITYLGGDEKGMGVSERMHRLRDVWDFVCACALCKAEAGM